MRLKELPDVISVFRLQTDATDQLTHKWHLLQNSLFVSLS